MSSLISVSMSLCFISSDGEGGWSAPNIFWIFQVGNLSGIFFLRRKRRILLFWYIERKKLRDHSISLHFICIEISQVNVIKLYVTHKLHFIHQIRHPTYDIEIQLDHFSTRRWSFSGSSYLNKHPSIFGMLILVSHFRINDAWGEKH